MYLNVDVFSFILLNDSLCYFNLKICIFAQFLKSFGHHLFKYILWSLLGSLCLELPYNTSQDWLCATCLVTSRFYFPAVHTSVISEYYELCSGFLAVSPNTSIKCLCLATTFSFSLFLFSMFIHGALLFSSIVLFMSLVHLNKLRAFLRLPYYLKFCRI